MQRLRAPQRAGVCCQDPGSPRVPCEAGTPLCACGQVRGDPGQADRECSPEAQEGEGRRPPMHPTRCRARQGQNQADVPIGWPQMVATAGWDARPGQGQACRLTDSRDPWGKMTLRPPCSFCTPASSEPRAGAQGGTPCCLPGAPRPWRPPSHPRPPPEHQRDRPCRSPTSTVLPSTVAVCLYSVSA